MTVYAGDIAAAVGFKRYNYWGYYYVMKRIFVILEKMEFPEPVIELSY